MHAPNAFRETDPAVLAALIDAEPFGLLIDRDDAGMPRASHLPFAIERDADGAPRALHTHVARNNPQAASLTDGAPVLIVFAGPHAYVSPDWFPEPAGHVPTWNYVAVHVRGRAVAAGESASGHHLRDFTRRFEGAHGWSPEALAPGLAERLQSAVLALEIRIESLEGIRKLGQNKPRSVRRAVAGALAGSPRAGDRALAVHMREPGWPTMAGWRARWRAARRRLGRHVAAVRGAR